MTDPVDAPRPPLYVAGASSGPRRLTPLVCALAVLVVGCARSSPAPAPGPEIEAEEVAREAREATRLDAPARVLFSWRLNESGRRLGGRGAARMEPPYRARLDLFLENGETAARAALVGGELRLPPEVEPGLVPPPPLLWASLGVFHPGADAVLLDGRAGEDGEIRLRFALSDDRELRYVLRDGEVRQAELVRDGHVIERVRVEEVAGPGEVPGEAVYRDLAAFRELTVTVESIEEVEGHPPGIWHVGE